MAEYRTHMRIITDVLYTARDGIQDRDGASVTCLIKNANVSHSRLTGILGTLVSQGLLERSEVRGPARYRISDSGREFLVEYQKFSQFAESFGLTI